MFSLATKIAIVTVLRIYSSKGIVPMMTRKDFEALATAIRDVREIPSVWQNDVALSGVIVAARKIADAYVESNERFDRDRFLRACGV